MLSAGIMYSFIKIFLYFSVLPIAVELLFSILLGVTVYISVLLLFYEDLRRIRKVKQLKSFFSQLPNNN
jgi:ABC-type polysaccharide/polyol phosphate export permease